MKIHLGGKYHRCWSRQNAVCVYCKKSRRFPILFFGDSTGTKCPSCRRNFVHLGLKIRVPKQDDDKGWEKIRKLPFVIRQLQMQRIKEEEANATQPGNDNSGVIGVPKTRKKKHFSRRYNLRREIET